MGISMSELDNLISRYDVSIISDSKLSCLLYSSIRFPCPRVSDSIAKLVKGDFGQSPEHKLQFCLLN